MCRISRRELKEARGWNSKISGAEIKCRCDLIGCGKCQHFAELRTAVRARAKGYGHPTKTVGPDRGQTYKIRPRGRTVSIGELSRDILFASYRLLIPFRCGDRLSPRLRRRVGTVTLQRGHNQRALSVKVLKDLTLNFGPIKLGMISSELSLI